MTKFEEYKAIESFIKYEVNTFCQQNKIQMHTTEIKIDEFPFISSTFVVKYLNYPLSIPLINRSIIEYYIDIQKPISDQMHDISRSIIEDLIIGKCQIIAAIQEHYKKRCKLLKRG